MLRAGVFDEFKGAKTLLLWGDEAGMIVLLAGLSALQRSGRNALVLDEGKTRLTVCSVAAPTEWSRLRLDGDSLRWECSADTLALAEGLVGGLLDGAGHQFLDVSGEAEQVIIARDEYPADLD